MMLRLFVPAAAGLSLLTVPALAHHSNAAYDQTHPITFQGAISKVEWESPHARIYVDTKGESGETVTWNVELPSPVTLLRRGWKRDSLKVGDTVTVVAFPALSHKTMAVARAVTDAAGKSYFGGTAPEPR